MAHSDLHLMLIRHAEKPDRASGVRGVDEQGHEDEQALSVRGWQRAGALVRLFGGHGSRGMVSPLAVPGAVFAATDAGRSRRPLCTVQPLARALGLRVDTRFGSEQDPAALLRALSDCGAPVLLCWRHQALGPLAQALAGPGRAPAQWDAARCDLVWVLRRQGDTWGFSEVPQRLLDGDT